MEKLSVTNCVLHFSKIFCGVVVFFAPVGIFAILDQHFKPLRLLDIVSE